MISTLALLISLTFEPPAAKVTAKYITDTPAYVVDCDDQSRHIVTKAIYDTINIGDTCPN